MSSRHRGVPRDLTGALALGGCLLSGCGSTTPAPDTPPPAAVVDSIEEPSRVPSSEETLPEKATNTFGDDLTFLKQHTNIVLLQTRDGRAQVAVAPEYQGRVMTSSAAGPDGASFGWIHRPVIEKAEPQPHMTVLGGEDRFWLGPEGGQFGLYFPPGSPFEFEHWQVPQPIDWGGWKVTAESATEVSFETSMNVTNHSGTTFSIGVRRTVRLLDDAALIEHLGTALSGDVRAVGYESRNTITNTGEKAWVKETGLVSIWILGMFTPSPTTTVAIPVKPGDEAKLGPAVKDDYFGDVPDDRLLTKSGVVFFKGDGQMRGKIGIPRSRAMPVAGSYDAEGQVLTLVQYTLPDDAVDYVDSRWAKQSAPYAGDVVNSYNDGPPEPGAAPLGPFYEIESSSPAAALAPGASLAHVHRTIHLQGPPETLNAIAKTQLGVTVQEIAKALSTDE